MLSMMKFWTTPTTFCIPVIVWLMTVAVFPAAAYAQKAAPSPNLMRSPSPLIGFAIIATFAVVIVAISLLPSKRGHQD